MKGKITTAILGMTLIGAQFIAAQATDTYNNNSRFLRWRADNEYILSVQNSDPFYGAKVGLETKDDDNRLAQRWEYNKLTGQIIGMNDYCLGVGGQYEIMLKDCSETETHTLWNFDEYGRLVGSVNVTGIREARCLEGEEVKERVEMKYVECSDNATQKFELEGTTKTENYNDILLYNDGQQEDSLFNVITTDQDLETLRDAIQLLGAEQNLRNESLTILAPTDEAFNQLPQETKEYLFSEAGRDDLNELIANHVIPKASLEELIFRAGATTLSGNHLQLIDNKIIGEANLIETDTTARNGLVHKIDKVLIPSNLSNLNK